MVGCIVRGDNKIIQEEEQTDMVAKLDFVTAHLNIHA